MLLTVTKKFEFDAAHRLPHHSGLCRNIHGHRYVLEVTIQGEVNRQAGVSSEGMLIDFTDLKALVKEALVGKWDHAILLYEKDSVLEDTRVWSDQRVIRTAYIPTAENMALDAFQILGQKIRGFAGGTNLVLKRLRLSETPTSWAEVEG